MWMHSVTKKGKGTKRYRCMCLACVRRVSLDQKATRLDVLLPASFPQPGPAFAILSLALVCPPTAISFTKVSDNELGGSACSGALERPTVTTVLCGFVVPTPLCFGRGTILWAWEELSELWVSLLRHKLRLEGTRANLPHFLQKFSPL